MPLVWLNDVKPDDSVAWLASLVTAAPDTGERHDRVAQDGDAPRSPLHNVPAADRTLEGFVAPAQPGMAAQRHGVLARQRRAARPARGCWRG